MTALFIKEAKNRIDDYLNTLQNKKEIDRHEIAYWLGKTHAIYDIVNNVMDGNFNYRMGEVSEIALKNMKDE